MSFEMCCMLLTFSSLSRLTHTSVAVVQITVLFSERAEKLALDWQQQTALNMSLLEVQKP